METVACPTPGEIAQLLLGELTGAQSEQLHKHVQTCSMCIATLQVLEKISGSSNVVAPRPAPVSVTPLEALSPPAAPTESPEDKLYFLTPPAGPDELGRLAQYRVLRVLGEGGMGMVLEAEDTQLERHVAVKVIKPEFRNDKEVQQRFMREARAMAQVKSDHVVTVFDVGQHNDTCYIVMELLEGGSLDGLLQRESRPTFSEIVRIGREISQALAAAHARGLIHRDIKPENVWLEAPHGRVKLLDFGLARPQEVTSRLTSSGMIIGSPLYMSPEQARGADLDERTDLFSLGCLLYALISGQTPFGRITILDTLLALATEAPAPPSQSNPLCPPDLDALTLSLLAKSPEDRPRTAGDVIIALERLEGKKQVGGAGTTDTTGGTNAPRSPSEWLQNKVEAAPTVDNASQLSKSRISGSRKAERRQVTVLVCGCDLFESEQFLEDTPVEEQETLIRSFEQACRQHVEQLKGTVVQCGPEGLIACFGYPVAQEDGAALACTAAVNILRAMPALDSAPWLAVHTGTAICSQDGATISLAGDARNVALKLKDHTVAGQIVLSDATRNMLRGNSSSKFSYTSLGTHKFKGSERDIEVFQLDDSGEADTHLSLSIPIELTPLTGRDLELNLLKERWRQSQEDGGQVVLLVGEAGLGKSRLVRALKDHVGDAGQSKSSTSAVIEWRCSPHFRSTGLYPASNCLQRLLEFRRDDRPPDQFERLVKHLDKLGLATREVVPLFASLLSLAPDARFPTLALSPAKEREEVFRALREWLRAYAAAQPILFVIEDLHWLDASTLQFLTDLLSEPLDENMLVLLTFRPEFRTPWPALPHQTSLSLNRLSKRQVLELMQLKTGTTVPEAVADEVYDRSNGVPLFAEEFTRMVQESGMLSAKPGDAHLGKTFMARAIPAALQDLLMARLDQMEGDRELAQLASALGRGFSYTLLAAVCGMEGEALDAELAKLVKAEILYQKGRPPDSAYHFKHALLEDALYNAMVKSHRQQCHARIAEALEKRVTHTTANLPELIAHHLTEAGLTERAVGYWLAAGFKAQEQFANIESINHFTKGLELLKTLPESTYRDRMELAFLSPLGSAYQITMGYAAPQSGPAFARARALCEKFEDCAQLFEVMWGNWCWHLVRADLKLCAALCDEMKALASKSGDRDISMEAYVADAVTNYYLGNFQACREYCEQAAAQYEDLEQCALWSARLGQNSAVVHRSYLAVSLWHLGFPEKALQVNAETVALARKLGQPFSLAHALYFSTQLYLYCRLPDEAQAVAKEEANIAREQKFALWEATSTFQSGVVASLIQAPDAIAKIERGLNSFKELAARLTVPAQSARLVDAYIRNGNHDQARRLLDEAMALLEKNEDRVFLAELYRLKAVMAQVDGDLAGAAGFFKQAIESAQAQGSRGWELRCTIGLAKLLQQQGRADQARAALSTIYGAYKEGLHLPELQEAASLLTSLA